MTSRNSARRCCKARLANIVGANICLPSCRLNSMGSRPIVTWRSNIFAWDSGPAPQGSISTRCFSACSSRSLFRRYVRPTVRPAGAMRGETTDEDFDPNKRYSDQLKNDPGPSYTGDRKKDENIFLKYYRRVLALNTYRSDVPGGFHYKPLLEYDSNGLRTTWMMPWYGRTKDTQVRIPAYINPTYIKWPPAQREVWRRNRMILGKYRIWARPIALSKRNNYADSFRDCPTIYLRVKLDYQAQVENDKYKEEEDIWDDKFQPIRGIPHFDAKLGDRDPGPKYTGDKMFDLELMLGYYMYKIKVRHHSALQKLFWKPSWDQAVPDTRHHIKPPPALKDGWIYEDTFPLIVVRWRNSTVSPEVLKLFEIILKRNDMYNGTYDVRVDKWGVIIQATFEALACITVCLCAYYFSPRIYSVLTGGYWTGSDEAEKQPASDFEMAHRAAEEKQEKARAAESTVEPHPESPQQPASRWAQIRANMSNKK